MTHEALLSQYGKLLKLVLVSRHSRVGIEHHARGDRAGGVETEVGVGRLTDLPMLAWEPGVLAEQRSRPTVRQQDVRIDFDPTNLCGQNTLWTSTPI